jgi:hypothetical protein
MPTANVVDGSITCAGFTNTGPQAISGNLVASGGATITGLRTLGNTATAITAARVLTALDSGGVFTVAQATNPVLAYAITLPTPTGAGLRFVLQLGTASDRAVTITAAGCTFEGTIIQALASAAAGATCTFVASTSAVGDSIEFISTSATKYFARAVTSVAGGITIA